MGDGTTLVESTFEELFQTSRLPSGHEFQLMPDTMDIGLRVAEVNDPKPWKQKALEAYTVIKTVGSHDVQESGPSFIHGMLDTDVTFLSLAWAAQMDGMSFDLEDGIPCATCTQKFMKVDFGGLVVLCRTSPVGGPDAMFPVEDVTDDELPKSMQGSTVHVCDPTWMAAKSALSEKAWGAPQAVIMRRVMSCIRVSGKSSGFRAPSMAGEIGKMRMPALRKIVRVMDMNIPHFKMQLDLKCSNCGEVSIIPFEQGL